MVFHAFRLTCVAFIFVAVGPALPGYATMVGTSLPSSGAADLFGGQVTAGTGQLTGIDSAVAMAETTVTETTAEVAGAEAALAAEEQQLSEAEAEKDAVCSSPFSAKCVMLVATVASLTASVTQLGLSLSQAKQKADQAAQALQQAKDERDQMRNFFQGDQEELSNRDDRNREAINEVLSVANGAELSTSNNSSNISSSPSASDSANSIAGGKLGSSKSPIHEAAARLGYDPEKVKYVVDSAQSVGAAPSGGGSDGQTGHASESGSALASTHALQERANLMAAVAAEAGSCRMLRGQDADSFFMELHRKARSAQIRQRGAVSFDRPSPSMGDGAVDPRFL